MREWSSSLYNTTAVVNALMEQLRGEPDNATLLRSLGTFRHIMDASISVADPESVSGSGSADPDPAISVIDLQDANKKKFFFKSFSLSFFKDKKSKRSHKALRIKVS